MIKLLAWQRIQQLFPPKGASPQTSVSPPAAPKPPALLPDSKPRAAASPPALASVSVGADLRLKLYTGQKKVQARAVFYPLTGKGQAVNMCYRTLYIGSGKGHSLISLFLRALMFSGTLTPLFSAFDAPANTTVFPPEVPTWMCALRITVIATTYPGNTPAFSTMRYVTVSIVVNLPQGLSG